ncbi:hypothetical protein OG852_39585 [Streptomyces sp. NBC_00582]|nr:hypothetical protein OG852_39585 [Streptomyces sp. NBC_00582]
MAARGRPARRRAVRFPGTGERARRGTRYRRRRRSWSPRPAAVAAPSAGPGIGYEAPVTRTGTYAVHLWLERLGTTGLTYGFRFCSVDGATTHARGTRVLVRLDAATLRPAPWSDGFRAAARALLRTAD